MTIQIKLVTNLDILEFMVVVYYMLLPIEEQSRTSWERGRYSRGKVPIIEKRVSDNVY